jgi:hypothetical protein
MLAERQDIDVGLNNSMSGVARASIHKLRWLASPDVISDPRWDNLIPEIYGLDNDPKKEEERVRVFIDWVWGCVELIQPYADSIEIGQEWHQMTKQRTRESVKVVKKLAYRKRLRTVVGSIDDFVVRRPVGYSQNPEAYYKELIAEWAEIAEGIDTSHTSTLAFLGMEVLYCIKLTFPGRHLWGDDTVVDMLERFLVVN